MSTTSKGRVNRTALAAAGFFLLHLLCCGLPLLIAAGALGGAGSVLGNPWLIAAAGALTAGVLVRVLRRRRAGTPKTDDQVCCAPEGTPGPGPAGNRIMQPTVGG